jgi:hypothetical protein
MSLSVPTVEPATARAGDTWRWTRDLPDYPAPTWGLTYTLFASSGVLSIVATASGALHSVSLAPATTALYPASRYDWVAHASNGTDRFQVGAGVLQVLPDVAEATAYDGRSHARKMLDAINAMLEGRATGGDLDVVRVAHGDRVTEWDIPTLLKLRQQYAAAVIAEDAAAALARGEQSGRMIQVRFVG